MDKQQFLMRGSITSTGPRTVLLGWGPRSLCAQASSGHPAFYFPDYFLADAQPWIAHPHTCEMDIEALLELLTPPPCCSPLTWSPSPSSHFTDAVEELLHMISSQQLTKAVPYAFTTAAETLSPSHIHKSLYHALLYVQQHPGYLYGTWHPSEGILGVTPELLFSLHKQVSQWKVKTAALAGTAPTAVDLYHPKLIHEHQVVVDGICQSLAPFGNPTVGSLAALQLPRLAHLKTPIEMKLHSEISSEQLVRALHPTPALGAFPRKEGERWLRAFDAQCPRYRYGAPVGYRLPDAEISHCYVAIRNVQWREDQSFISAGCGIVAGSSPEEEWREIQLKTKAIKDILAL